MRDASYKGILLLMPTSPVCYTPVSLLFSLFLGLYFNRLFHSIFMAKNHQVSNASTNSTVPTDEEGEEVSRDPLLFQARSVLSCHLSVYSLTLLPT